MLLNNSTNSWGLGYPSPAVIALLWVVTGEGYQHSWECCQAEGSGTRNQRLVQILGKVTTLRMWLAPIVWAMWECLPLELLQFPGQCIYAIRPERTSSDYVWVGEGHVGTEGALSNISEPVDSQPPWSSDHQVGSAGKNHSSAGVRSVMTWQSTIPVQMRGIVGTYSCSLSLG